MSVSRSKFAEAFAAQQLADEAAAQRASGAAERRQTVRQEHYEPADMLLDATVSPVTLTDISELGIAVRVLKGKLPERFDVVSIRLRDGRHLHGSPAWIGDGCFGLKFDATLENVGDIVHLENRGAAVYLGVTRPSNRFETANSGASGQLSCLTRRTQKA